MACSASFSQDESSFQDVPVLSLSAGGMFVAIKNSSQTFTRGDEIAGIRLDISELEDISIDGSVVHTMSLGEIGGCGIEYRDINDPDLERLNDYVESKLKEFGLWNLA